MLKKTGFLSVSIVAILVIVSLLFNNAVIRIRLQEADYYLYKVALNQFAQNTFIISSKYNMIKSRIEKGGKTTENYNLEGLIQSVLSEDDLNLQASTYKPLSKYHPVFIILKSLRLILGKEPMIQTEKRDILNHDLEVAYFFERSRYYHKAIKIYDRIIKSESEDLAIYPSVLLHKAFCISMLGDFKESRLIYSEIHSKYPDTEAGILSGKMESFLIDLIKRNKVLLASRKNNLEIGRQLFFNMKYNDALVYLNKVISEGNSASKSEAYYYKGRIHEELGESGRAVKTYYKIMHLNRDTRWFKDANRRLVMLNNVYKQDHPLVKDAEKNLKEINDTQFLKDINELNELIKLSPVKEALIDKNRNENDISEDSLFKSIKKVEKSEKMIKKKLEIKSKTVKQTNKLQKKKLTKEEKIAMKRKLANSKYRKASFLREKIEGNTSKLHDIYISYLNSGKKIKGRMVIEMNIQSNGRINATIKSTNITDNNFNTEIIKEIRRWKFPPLEEDLGVLTISYPFSFEQ